MDNDIITQFIGFFCLQAGVGLSIGEDVSSIQDMTKVLNPHALTLVAPALAGGALLAWVSKNVSQWFALPLCLLLLPSVFYLWMLVSETSFAQAQAEGWLAAPRSEVSELAFVGLCLVCLVEIVYLH